QAAELARRWFPNCPPLLWALAQRAFEGAAYRDAAELLEHLIHLGRSGTYDRSAAFDPSLMGDLALFNLGNCYLRLGDEDRAEACFTALLTSATHQTQARRGCDAVQALRSRTAEVSRQWSEDREQKSD